VAGVTASSTAAAVVVCVNIEAGSNGSIVIYHLNKMRKSEARSNSDGEMHNAVICILEETVMSADCAGDPTELLKMAADVFRGETVRDR
jgi:hypothetical protein